jgi:hypothetical protein
MYAHQNAAKEEMTRAKELLMRITSSATEISRQTLAREREALEAEIKMQTLQGLVRRLHKAGRSLQEITDWLEMSLDSVAEIVQSIADRSRDRVEISESGRGGMIHYHAGDRSITFHWEFGGGYTVALIFVPDEATWEGQTGFPLANRMRILDFTAQEVLKQKARDCIYLVQDSCIEIIRVL